MIFYSTGCYEIHEIGNWKSKICKECAKTGNLFFHIGETQDRCSTQEMVEEWKVFHETRVILFSLLDLLMFKESYGEWQNTFINYKLLFMISQLEHVNYTNYIDI